MKNKKLKAKSYTYIVVSILTSVIYSIQPFALKRIFDNSSSFEIMKKSVLIYGLSIVLLISTEYLSKILSVRINLDLTKEIRNEICNSIQFSDRFNSSKEKLSEINVDLNSNIDEFIETYYVNRLDIVVLLISLAVYGYAIVNLDLKMIFIILIPNFIAVLIPYLYKGKVESLRESALKNNEIFNNRVLDFLSGIKVLKNMFAEKYWRRAVDKSSETNIKTNQKLGDLNSFIESLIGFISFTGSLVLLAYGVLSISRKTMTLGTLVASFQFSEIITVPIIRLISSINTLHSGKVIYKQLMDRYFYEKNYTENKPNVKRLGDFYKLSIENFSFSYGDNLKMRFDSLEIRKGDKVLVRGANGSGKSTFMSIISGFERDYNGKIFFNDVDLSELSNDELNLYYSMLEQNSFIFNASLDDNLTLYSDIRLDKYSDILSMVKYHEIPKTDTTSQSLSGGEKQRICLARALIREKEILTVDEQLNQIQKDNRLSILEEILNDKDLTFFYISHDSDDISSKFNVIITVNGNNSSFERNL